MNQQQNANTKHNVLFVSTHMDGIEGDGYGGLVSVYSEQMHKHLMKS